MQTVDKDKILLIRQVTQTEGWRILKARWQELSEHSKTELANRLRKPSEANFYEAVKLQERIDSVDFIMKDVLRLLSDKDGQNDPGEISY